MKLDTTVLQTGKTTTGIEVPSEVVEALGAGKRPAVTVTVNGYTYRSTIASMGGRFMLPVSADVRQQAGIAGGDAVEVTIERDTAPRRSPFLRISAQRWMPTARPAASSTASPTAISCGMCWRWKARRHQRRDGAVSTRR
jgi:antitoxin component of MazEF toxin-antitoxin module